MKNWLSRFARAARWYLPPAEADDVIGDYRELLAEDARSEEDLYRELGKPRLAVKPLTDHRAYRIWLAVFAVTAACILALGISPWDYVLWEWLFVNRPFGCQLGAVLALLGAAGAVVWFRRKGHKGETLLRGVPVLLVILLVWLALVLGASWAWLHDPLGFAEMWGEMPSLLGPERMVSRSIQISLDVMCYGAPLLAAVGVFALVKARTADRRWAAVYVLAMTAMLVSLKQLAVISDMSMDPGHEWAVLSGYFYRWVTLAAVGLVGTGVALC